MKKALTHVTIVIPHYNGEALLRRCLHTLRDTAYTEYDVVVVDNGSEDNSRTMIREEFPEVLLVESRVNLGFAGGCNLGIQATMSPFVVLLNNDTEVEPGWLDPLVETMESNPARAAVQSKLLSLQDRKKFDYAGASGGEMDVFGYPFTWGRIFDFIEHDTGQYDEPRSVFWASGAAVMLRRSALEKVGCLDESFFAHFEEIDLAWRLHWAGYTVMVEPRSVVFHRTASTLSTGRLRKMVLNHRNSLLVLLKNLPLAWMFCILPLRLMLEGFSIIASFFIGQPKRAAAVLLGLSGIIPLWPTVLRGRKRVTRIRTVSEASMLNFLYRGSIVFDYYIRKKKTVPQLNFRDRQSTTVQSQTEENERQGTV